MKKSVHSGCSRRRALTLLGAGAVALALFIYLVLALLKPEWFG